MFGTARENLFELLWLTGREHVGVAYDPSQVFIGSILWVHVSRIQACALMFSEDTSTT